MVNKKPIIILILLFLIVYIVNAYCEKTHTQIIYLDDGGYIEVNMREGKVLINLREHKTNKFYLEFLNRDVSCGDLVIENIDDDLFINDTNGYGLEIRGDCTGIIDGLFMEKFNGVHYCDECNQMVFKVVFRDGKIVLICENCGKEKEIK